MKPSLAALLTDFGARDPYVGVMKGVILSKCPAARIVDLCHGVPPQDVAAAAYDLMTSVSYFEPRTLFVAVVDPGVGTGRRVLWARTKRHQFLGPDNGILSWVERVEKFVEAREVTNSKLFLPAVGSTFQGRDVFAPVAGALLQGARPERLGPPARRWERLAFPAISRRGKKILGEVIAVDRFGNAVTNLGFAEDVPRRVFYCRGKAVGRLAAAYAAAPAGRPAAVVGSSGFIELALRNASFAGRRRVRVGDRVEARLR
ncbi:MAG: SAM-dependent chlorinase/fluorinase [Elusimicrobia bacterium]|nr:SAM-dependent chlorinase/fluorinase [Elusimicrobiota bacterium]